MNLNNELTILTSWQLILFKFILELSVKFASQICHENINKPLDGAYLADFGIDITPKMDGVKWLGDVQRKNWHSRLPIDIQYCMKDLDYPTKCKPNLTICKDNMIYVCRLKDTKTPNNFEITALLCAVNSICFDFAAHSALLSLTSWSQKSARNFKIMWCLSVFYLQT